MVTDISTPSLDQHRSRTSTLSKSQVLQLLQNSSCRLNFLAHCQINFGFVLPFNAKVKGKTLSVTMLETTHLKQDNLNGHISDRYLEESLFFSIVIRGTINVN